MNLNHLRYFVTLAHMEHYTKASERLNVTQPSLTYAMHSLESEIGVPLFEKAGRNVVLTRYGKQFLAEIEPALEQLDKSVDAMKEIGSGKEQLRIGFLSVLGMQYIPQLVGDFLKSEEGKKVSFQYHNDMTHDLLRRLEDGACDLVFSSYASGHPELEFVPVVRQDLVVVVPQDHPLAQKDEVDLREAAKYPQIYFHQRSGVRAIVDDLFEKIHVEPQIVMEVEEDRVIAGFVAQGFGIAVVPDMYVLDHLPVKRLHISYPDYRRDFYMVYRKDARPSEALQRLIHFAMEQAKKEKMEEHLLRL